MAGGIGVLCADSDGGIESRSRVFDAIGGGGLPGFYLADVSDSRIEGNSFHYSGAGPADGTVQIVGPFRRNVVRNNPGLGFPAGIR